MRKLTESEVECRVSTVSKKGCSLLLYKDARVDMKMLDEEYGPMNWQREHYMVGDRLYCTISIWDADKEQWISKQDVGVESYTEKEKGQASDSFKRAGFNWGIGRELYTAPFIWINAKDVNLEEKGDRFTTYDHFTLKHIAYDGDRISQLEIWNDRLKRVVYTYGMLSANQEKKPETKTAYLPVLIPTAQDKDSAATKEQIEQIKQICEDELVSVDFITASYNKKSLEELTRIQAYTVVNSWDKFKEKYKAQEKEMKEAVDEQIDRVQKEYGIPFK